MSITNDRQIIVKNSRGATIAYLTKEDLVYDAWIEERQNSESRLTLSFSHLSPKAFVLDDCNNEFHVDRKVFSLLNDDAITTERTADNKLISSVTAVELWQAELDTDYHKVYNSTTGFDHIDEHMVILVSGGSDLSGGKYTVGSAAHALYALLLGTEWTLNQCDVDGKFDLETDKKSTLTNIYSIQELWGGILIWDSVKRTVSLMKEEAYEPFNGFQIKYGKNQKEIAKSVSSNVFTRLYVYGEKNLNISSVNDGKEYIDNFEYSTKIRKHIISNPDITKADQLKTWGLRQSKILARPKVTYRTSILDLSALDEYIDVPFSVNDMCNVVDTAIVGTTDIRKRIVYKKYNVFQPCLCELEIGDSQTTLEHEIKKSTSTSTTVTESRTGTNKWDGYLDEKGVESKIDAVNEDYVIRLSNAERSLLTLQSADGIFKGKIIWDDKSCIEKTDLGINITSSGALNLNGIVYIPVGENKLNIGGEWAEWKQITYKNSSGADETSWVLSKI